MTKKPKRQFTGTARIIDFSEDRSTCRVRLYDAAGMPTGEVLTDVKYTPNDVWLNQLAKKIKPIVSDIPDNDLDTIAKQNLYYNSHEPVIIK